MEKLHKKSYHREKTHSTTAQVLKAYWAVVRSHRVAGVFILAAAVIAELSSIFTPIFYKQFFDVLTHSNGSAETVPILIKIIIYIAAINSVAWIFFERWDLLITVFNQK